MSARVDGLAGIVRFDDRPVAPGLLDLMQQAAPYRRPVPPLEDGSFLFYQHARLDTELTLRDAFRQFGTDCPPHLTGDFAFVIWNRHERRLFAARDLMAMRPLYYRVEPERVIFASEIKQILALPGIEARLFEPAVGAYLAGQFGRLDWTLYDGIKQLPPGHALEVETGGRVRTWNYGGLAEGLEPLSGDEAELVVGFRSVFVQAVRDRLRGGEKAAGVLLSGGLDSGSIAATIGHLKEKEPGLPPLNAYCFAFDEWPESDERHISDEIVRPYGIPSYDIPVSEAWPLKDYPAHGPDRDEPRLGVYQALLERAYAEARAHNVGLMFSGDRGDLIAGEYLYDYTGLFWRGHWPTLLKELRVRATWHGSSLPQEIRRHLLKPLRISLLGRPPLQVTAPDWVVPSWFEGLRLNERLDRIDIPDTLKGYARQQRYAAIRTPVHMRGAVWSERTLARFGITFVDPWSDVRVARYVLSMPQRVLNHTGNEKRLVREAMRGILPEPARRTADKISPGPVYEQTMREHARPLIEQHLTNMKADAYGFIDADALRHHYTAALEGGVLNARFWWALTLEMWLRRYWS